MTALAQLAEHLDAQGYILVVGLILARVAPVVYLTPFLGGPMLSTTVRFVVAAALAVAIFPAAYPGPGAVEFTHTGVFVLLLGKEILVGVCLGLLASVAFHALAMAGQMIDMARGTTQSTVSDPRSGDQPSPLSSLHLQLGIVVFVLMGGHQLFLAAVAGSYEVVPLVELPLAERGVQAVSLLAAELVGKAIAAALMMAAPAVAAALLVDLGLGLLGRTAPQVGTYFMAMPLRAAVGLAMVLLSISLLLPYLGPFLEQSVLVATRLPPMLR